MGADQHGQYERVIINRKDHSTAIDRMDVSWWHEAPFLARRDLFYPDPKDEKKLALVRHNFWVFKGLKFNT